MGIIKKGIISAFVIFKLLTGEVPAQEPIKPLETIILSSKNGSTPSNSNYTVNDFTDDIRLHVAIKTDKGYFMGDSTDNEPGNIIINGKKYTVNHLDGDYNNSIKWSRRLPRTRQGLKYEKLPFDNAENTWSITPQIIRPGQHYSWDITNSYANVGTGRFSVSFNGVDSNIMVLTKLSNESNKVIKMMSHFFGDGLLSKLSATPRQTLQKVFADCSSVPEALLFYLGIVDKPVDTYTEGLVGSNQYPNGFICTSKKNFGAKLTYSPTNWSGLYQFRSSGGILDYFITDNLIHILPPEANTDSNKKIHIYDLNGVPKGELRLNGLSRNCEFTRIEMYENKIFLLDKKNTGLNEADSLLVFNNKGDLEKELSLSGPYELPVLNGNTFDSDPEGLVNLNGKYFLLEQDFSAVRVLRSGFENDSIFFIGEDREYTDVYKSQEIKRIVAGNSSLFVSNPNGNNCIYQLEDDGLVRNVICTKNDFKIHDMDFEKGKLYVYEKSSTESRIRTIAEDTLAENIFDLPVNNNFFSMDINGDVAYLADSEGLYSYNPATNKYNKLIESGVNLYKIKENYPDYTAIEKVNLRIGQEKGEVPLGSMFIIGDGTWKDNNQAYSHTLMLFRDTNKNGYLDTGDLVFNALGSGEGSGAIGVEAIKDSRKLLSGTPFAVRSFYGY